MAHKSNATSEKKMGGGLMWREDFSRAPKHDNVGINMDKAKFGDTDGGGPTSVEHSLSGGKVKRWDTGADGNPNSGGKAKGKMSGY